MLPRRFLLELCDMNDVRFIGCAWNEESDSPMFDRLADARGFVRRESVLSDFTMRATPPVRQQQYMKNNVATNEDHENADPQPKAATNALKTTPLSR